MNINDMGDGSVWTENTFYLSEGYHKLEWVYSKMSQFEVTDSLSAEIEWIRIEGVKATNLEC